MRDHNGNWLAGFMSIGSTSVTEADTIHGTLPLKDEKQFIRGIKQLKQTHEKLQSTMSELDEIQQGLDRKEGLKVACPYSVNTAFGRLFGSSV